MFPEINPHTLYLKYALSCIYIERMTSQLWPFCFLNKYTPDRILPTACHINQQLSHHMHSNMCVYVCQQLFPSPPSVHWAHHTGSYSNQHFNKRGSGIVIQQEIVTNLTGPGPNGLDWAHMGTLLTILLSWFYTAFMILYCFHDSILLSWFYTAFMACISYWSYPHTQQQLKIMWLKERLSWI